MTATQGGAAEVLLAGQEITLLGTGKALTHNVEKTELDKNMTTKKYNFYRLILRFYRQCSCPFRKQSLKFLMPILSFPTVTSITGGFIPFLKFNENSTWALTSFFLTLYIQKRIICLIVT